MDYVYGYPLYGYLLQVSGYYVYERVWEFNFKLFLQSRVFFKKQNGRNATSL
jgi:hypothetical protein